jgi:hypothetical protein
MNATTPIKQAYADIEAYVTKDGSEIRELMHPARHGNTGQQALRILCACAPAYAHQDTELLSAP